MAVSREHEKANARVQVASLVALQPLANVVRGQVRQVAQLETTPPNENEPVPQAAEKDSMSLLAEESSRLQLLSEVAEHPLYAWPTAQLGVLHVVQVLPLSHCPGGH